MNLDNFYDQLWIKALASFEKQEFELDPLIDNKSDFRRGLTLLIRPDEETKKNISVFLNELKAVDPNQYYYPPSDFHITVMSIISCYQGFSLDMVSIDKYLNIIEKSLINILNEKIVLKGITASNSCIMLRGFPETGALNQLRDNLRQNFGESDLINSMDSRYVINAAHLTVMRFKNNPQNTTGLLKIIEKYKDFHFGKFEIKKFNFVFNDWYLRNENTRILNVFKSNT
jgi:2'-5' RNA ligase